MTKIKKITELHKINSIIAKEEKNLASFKKKKMAAEVIAAQEKVVFDLMVQKEELEKAKQMKNDGSFKDAKLTFAIIDDETGKVTKKQYKVAFVKNNRPINKNKVNGYISKIANDKYEKHAPIFAITAKETLESGYEVTDVNGKKVEKENAEDYLVILDGQHRTLAFLMCNMTEPREVPSTFIKTGIDIGQYIVDLNDVGTSWSQQDRFAVAALVSNDELAHEISDRISEKFNPTTASLIYTGKKISGTQVKKLLRGEKTTLLDEVGGKADIKRGNRFIQLCLEAKIEVKFITKRYFIAGFNSYAEEVGDDAAFKKLDSLKELNLTEKMLREIKDGTQFEKILRETA